LRHSLPNPALTLLIAIALCAGLACEDDWNEPAAFDDTGPHSPATLDEQAIPGRYVLFVDAGTTSNDMAVLADSHGLDLVDFDFEAGLALVEGSAADDALPLLEVLGAEDIVQWAEPDIAITLDLQPNDWKEAMWAFHNNGFGGGTVGADISAFNAWDETLGAGVVVALVDSGVDALHTDLGDRLWVNAGEIPGNERDDDENGFTDDVHGWDFASKDANPNDESGHGTSVAGLVVGRGNDNAGIFGVAWGARLMVLRAVAPEADGNNSAFAIARSLRYAASEGADIIVAALSTEGRSRALEDAVRHVDSKEVILVTSAGNAARDLDEQPLFPACMDLVHIVTVTSSDHDDKLSDWAGHGARCVDLAAPGEEIVTAFSTGEDGDNRYGRFSGTSMSVPLVAGGLALAWSVAADLSARDVIEAVLTGVDPLDEGAEKVSSGGRLNLEAAVNNALEEGEVEDDDRAECSPVGLITCGQVVGLDTSDSNSPTTDAMDDYSCRVGNYRGAEAAWEFLASQSGDYRWELVDPRPTVLDKDVFVLSGSNGICQSSACLAEDGYGPNGVTFKAESGRRYYLVVDGYNGEVGPFQARLVCPE